MKNTLKIGLDIGNFDSKTQNTTFPSGFEESESKPFGATDCLYYNGRYYCPNDNRFPYTQDKTKDNNCFILSLMCISNEIIFQAKQAIIERKKNKATAPEKTIQQEINDVKFIELGVGLPPTHVATLSDRLIKYYEDRMKNGIKYEYSGYTFSYALSTVKCYPQDFAALIAYAPENRNESPISYPSYYGIDIGGWTVDVVSVLNGRISITRCDSKPLGVLAMYESIIRNIEVNFGKRLAVTDIENLLQGKKSLISKEIRDAITNLVDEWYKSIMKSLKQFGVEPEINPIVFLGGGSILFKKNIMNDESIVLKEIMTNTRANAMGYLRCLEAGK